jgi:hypothetical protein
MVQTRSQLSPKRTFQTLVQTKTKDYAKTQAAYTPPSLFHPAKKPRNQKESTYEEPVSKPVRLSDQLAEADASESGSDSASYSDFSSDSPIVVDPISSSPQPSQAPDQSSASGSSSGDDSVYDSPPSDGGVWPGPRVPQCDDAGHCQNGHCLLPFTPCLWQIGVQSGTQAPLPHGALRTCHRCRQHERDLHEAVIDTRANRHRMSGYKGKLCGSCEKDEAKLYWDRYGRAQPQLGTPLDIVERWPSPQNSGEQNLCICKHQILLAHTTDMGGPSPLCCGCRRQYLDDTIVSRYTFNENVLLDTKKNVITGARPFAGDETDMISQGKYEARLAQNIGRSCPCGNVSEPRRANRLEYMMYCMACMGVQVISNRKLPPDLQKDAVAPRRNVTTRNGTRWGRTKGPRREPRGPNFRINMERGYIEHDPYMDPNAR